jgi:four helix bundle protein
MEGMWEPSTRLRTWKYRKLSAISLTSNLAEGYGRFHFKENIQFCRVSRGSACELLDHLITCGDEGYLEKDEHQELRRHLLMFLRLLNGYIRSIGKTGEKNATSSGVLLR